MDEKVTMWNHFLLNFGPMTAPNNGEHPPSIKDRLATIVAALAAHGDLDS
jgi:hypothetical protein